jgi:hypothetical protein
MKFVVMYKGQYLVELPHWNLGTWTTDPLLATVHGEGDQDFFPKYYPQFEMIPATPEQIEANEARREARIKATKERHEKAMKRLKDRS